MKKLFAKISKEIYNDPFLLIPITTIIAIILFLVFGSSDGCSCNVAVHIQSKQDTISRN